MASMLSRFPRLRASLQGAEPSADARAIGPMHQVARSPVSDGVGLVGDASGYLDAITGEGISLALAQVQALYDSIGPWMLYGCLISKSPPVNRIPDEDAAGSQRLRLVFGH